MTKDGPRVAVIGPTNVDLLIRGEAPLDPAELRAWVGPSDVSIVAAGSIGYTVQVMARLGLEVEVCTTVGRDPFGRLLSRMLDEAGLGTTYVAAADGDTAIAVYVLLFGGSKRPMTYRLPTFPAWPDPPPVLDGRRPRPDLVHSGGLLHFPDLYHGGLAGVFAEARTAGILTSVDPQFPLTPEEPPWSRFCDDVLAASDVLLCDEGEARAMFGVTSVEEAIEAAHRAGPRVVAIKRAAEGSIVSDGRKRLTQPAIPVPEERARETVGAGDAYDAGFLDALVRGSAIDFATRWATATAALSLMGRGGAEGVTDRRQVEFVLADVPPAQS
jgi:sugar/nucleoside kinase (ribokinase family)